MHIAFYAVEHNSELLCYQTNEKKYWFGDERNI